MSSYFVNSTFPVTLPGGQESFLGQIPLYSPGYTDPLRHYPTAAYGATSVQDKAYPSSYYQQASGAFGRTSTGSACDYSAANFYREKDAVCTISSLEEHSLVLSQDQRKSECPAQNNSIFTDGDEMKCSAPVYPWMQRMNSCNGESASVVFVCSLHDACLFGCCSWYHDYSTVSDSHLTVK